MATNVTCSCGSRLRVTSELIGKRVKCPTCGERWVLRHKTGPDHKPTYVPSIQQNCAVVPPQSNRQLHGSNYESPHHPPVRANQSFTHNNMVDPQQCGTHTLTSFPVAAIVLLSVMTLGVIVPMWICALHGQLPKIRANDPSRRRAMLLALIPVFNFYWIFFSFHRLSVRLNEQLAIAGKRETVPTALGMTALALLFIPFLNWVSLLVLLPMFSGIVQSRINQLAEDTGQQIRDCHGHQQSALAYPDPAPSFRVVHHDQIPQQVADFGAEPMESISLELS